MSDGYTPVFNSVFDGTLYGKWPESAVWLTMLALCDSRGQIDKSYEAIAGQTGWPMELLKEGIAALMSPDPRSRSPAEDGRRLVLIDPAREWGWRVVNVQLYRRKASGQNQIVDGRNAEKVRRYKDRHRQTPRDTDRHLGTPEDTQDTQDTHSDSDANTDSDKNPQEKTPVGKKRARARRPIPGTAFPEDFTLDERMRDQALSHAADCDVEKAFEAFKAHHVANGTESKNWRMSWVTWIGNFEQFGYPKLRPANGAVPAGMEKVRW